MQVIKNYSRELLHSLHQSDVDCRIGEWRRGISDFKDCTMAQNARYADVLAKIFVHDEDYVRFILGILRTDSPSTMLDWEFIQFIGIIAFLALNTADFELRKECEIAYYLLIGR